MATATKANTEDIKADTTDIKALLIENTRQIGELHALHIQGRTVDNATPEQLKIQADVGAHSLKQISVAAKAITKAQAVEAKAQAAADEAAAKAEAKASAAAAKAEAEASAAAAKADAKASAAAAKAKAKEDKAKNNGEMSGIDAD